MAVGSHQHILTAQHMALLAVGNLVGGVADVLAMCNGLEVLGVDAPRRIASVMNLGTFRGWAKVMLEHPTMHHETPRLPLVGYPDLCVSRSAQRAHPNPARAWKRSFLF